MYIASYTNVKPEVASARTYEDFYKFLGQRPKFMGVMARMSPNNTVSFLTEGLGNIFYNQKQTSKFQPINSLCVEWNIETEFIKKVAFAAAPNGTGSGGTEITMYFTERYYEMFDTFIVDGSRQQFIVLAVPVRKADNFWEYTVKLIDTDYSAVLDTNYTAAGTTTRFLSNIQPELNERGYIKYQSNVEKHRTWIGEIRCDIQYSARYAAMEDQFIKISKGEGTGELQERLFKLNKMEKDLFDNFQVAKNNSLLLGKTTMDANGKATIQTADGRPLIAGDGLIPQIERFASKYKYAKMNINVINTMMSSMVMKSANAQGNHYTFILNDAAWTQVNVALADWLKLWGSTPTVIYSKTANDNIEVGGTFTTYKFSGNTITFMVDRVLTKHFGSKGYGICLDTTPDMSTNQPAIGLFTLAGSEFISSKYVGHGGANGVSSGLIASPIAGSSLIVSGYAGMAVFAPYKSFIIEQI